MFSKSLTSLFCTDRILIEPATCIQHQQLIISIRTWIVRHKSGLININQAIDKACRFTCIYMVVEFSTFFFRESFSEYIFNISGTFQVSVMQSQDHTIFRYLQVSFQIVSTDFTSPTISGFSFFRSPVSSTTVSHHCQFGYIISYFLQFSRQGVHMHTINIHIRVVELLIFTRRCR